MQSIWDMGMPVYELYSRYKLQAARLVSWLLARLRNAWHDTVESSYIGDDCMYGVGMYMDMRVDLRPPYITSGSPFY